MRAIVFSVLLYMCVSVASAGPHVITHTDEVPDAVIDLRTDAGVGQVQGAWRYHDATLVQTDHHQPGPDGMATVEPDRTYDIEPRAGEAGYNDSNWPVIDPTSLEQRRSSGRLCFGWYRINITIPREISGYDPTGSAVVFEIVADDYAEVWVDGQLPLQLGQCGGPVVAGWNAPNRVVLTRDARPGQTFRLAVFVANGPISRPPANYIWIRGATLDFYRPQRAQPGEPVAYSVISHDPRMDKLVSGATTATRLATGFGFTEGPVWRQSGTDASNGMLLFSDPNNNLIYRWSEDDGLAVFRSHSGYTGPDIDIYRQPGSNGLTLDPQGRLSICEHGNRRVTRLEANGALTVLADHYQGKRLNSPNDLVYRSDGVLYFTDPPFGLPLTYDDPGKELTHSGVYCLVGGELKLVSTDLMGPNGLAFSPDEQYLYVGNWDGDHKVVMRYKVLPDGSLVNGVVFFDMTDSVGEEALDGLKVDAAGNVFVSGPGGVWVISPAGEHLGTLVFPELPANFAWGDPDRRTLYLTARSSLYRIRLNTTGADTQP